MTIPVVPLPIDVTDMDNDAVRRTVSNLISICKDGEAGFKTAADGADNATFKSLFMEYSQQRRSFASELANFAATYGTENMPSGNPLGGLHRAFIDIKAAVSGRDEGAILAECERGEDAAKGAYEHALEEVLPENLRVVIEKQYSAVRHTHDYVRSLRDQWQKK